MRQTLVKARQLKSEWNEERRREIALEIDRMKEEEEEDEEKKNLLMFDQEIYDILKPLNEWPENTPEEEKDDDHERHNEPDPIQVGRPLNDSASNAISRGLF